MPVSRPPKTAIAIGLALATVLARPGAAGAADSHPGWYVAGKGGPSYSAIAGIKGSDGGTVGDTSANNLNGAFGMAAGYEFMHRHGIPLRAELEFMNRTEVTYDASPLLTSPASGALASTAQNITTMAKVFWHFPVDSTNWWPFASAGIGWSRNTVKSQYTPTGVSATRITQATNALAWSLGIGASMKLGPQVMNDIELRWVGLGKLDWGLPSGVGIEATGVDAFTAVELNFAIRFVF
jgi:opacity protein-like surface antigen